MPILTLISSVKITRFQSSAVQCLCFFAYCNRHFRSRSLRKGRHLATLWWYPKSCRALRTIFSDASSCRSLINWCRESRRVFESRRICRTIWCLSASVNFFRWPVRYFVISVPRFFKSPRVPFGIFVILVISLNECRSPAIRPRAIFRFLGDHSRFFIMSRSHRIVDAFIVLFLREF